MPKGDPNGLKTVTLELQLGCYIACASCTRIYANPGRYLPNDMFFLFFS